MKKLAIATIALALPAFASAQTLISGYNFGQFIGEGYPSLDGGTFESVGSIGANYGNFSDAPPAETGGGYVGANSLPGNYQNPTGGRLYWDGSFGSSVDDYQSGTDLVAFTSGPNVIGGLTLDNVQMGLLGDDLNLGFRSQVSGNRLSFVENTSLFGDFVGQNLSFTAFASGSPATINWYLAGQVSPFATSNIASDTQFASVYSVDLPVSFFGQNQAVLVAEINGVVALDNVQFSGAAIPEPSTYAAILGLVTLGVVALRRRKRAVA